MISLDNPQTSKLSKTETKSSPNLASSEKDTDKPNLSFSELLKGIELKSDLGSKKDIKLNDKIEKIDLKTEVTLKKDELKDIDIKSVTSDKKESLMSLLKNDDKDLNVKDLVKLENFELNPKLTNEISDKLTVNEVKKLIFDAKQYLKSEIQKTEAFKKSETKELPKTLKGLISVADKFGVDVSKITLEKIQHKSIKQDTNVLSKVNDKVVSPKKLQKDEKIAEKPKVIEKYDEKLPKSVLNQPIVKVVDKKQFSTEEIIQAREIKVEPKKVKKSSDETLKMLLSGVKTEKKEQISIKSEISLVSAKVIVSEEKTKITEGLESLLHSDTSSKVDNPLNTHKIDSLEVKMNEAKQMIKYLSQDVKQAIEDYKAPFTRIKVQLNPEKLGEVDLTVIQRGKNLVVNLSSNNTAINTLSMNVNELRTQLNNNGINNATLNFSNNEQTQDQSSFNQQQSNQHNQRQAQQEYGYFDNEEQNEEILSSLEIVVPNYA